MSLDAIVWLVAGIGLGVGATLLLLVGYAGLERWRLSRRFRRARLLREVAEPGRRKPAVAAKPFVAARAEPAPIKPKKLMAANEVAVAPVVPKRAEPVLAKPAETSADEPVAPVAIAVEPVVVKAKPVLTVVPSEPVVAEVVVAEVQAAEPETPKASEAPKPGTPVEADPPKPADAPKPAEPTQPVVTAPVVVPQPIVEKTPPAPKRGPQSVEEMFAEAFALDKVSVTPLPVDGTDAPKG